MSATLTLADIQEQSECRTVQHADRAITFEQYLNLVGDRDAELINGVMIDRMAAQYDHENLFGWLFAILRAYVRERKLGTVLGSRTAVEIHEFGGRLPDLLFVQQDRLDIVTQRAIYGAPDLVIEIRSPNDRNSDVAGLETDYCNLGVREIVFIDPQRQRIRVLRRKNSKYTDEILLDGLLVLETVEGIQLPLADILQEPRPSEHSVTTRLLAAAQ